MRSTRSRRGSSKPHQSLIIPSTRRIKSMPRWSNHSSLYMTKVDETSTPPMLAYKRTRALSPTLTAKTMRSQVFHLNPRVRRTSFSRQGFISTNLSLCSSESQSFRTINTQPKSAKSATLSPLRPTRRNNLTLPCPTIRKDR